MKTSSSATSAATVPTGTEIDGSARAFGPGSRSPGTASAKQVGAAAFLLLAALPSALAAQHGPGMLVSASWVAAHLGEPGVVVVDAEIREQQYEAGHVPGAHFLDISRIMWEGNPPVGAEMRTPQAIDSAFEAAGVSDGQRVVVYSTNPLVAARVWTTLDAVGLGDDASVLDGGLAAWLQAGEPVSTERPAVARGKLAVHPRAGVVVDSEWVLHHLDDPAVTLLDSRTPAEYDGAVAEKADKVHAGHIPGAYDLDWETLVESPRMPKLLSRAQLNSMIRASGAKPGSTVVAYCQTGVRGSFDYFVARLLGYDARLYDGSWQEWGSKDLPYVSGKSRK